MGAFGRDHLEGRAQAEDLIRSGVALGDFIEKSRVGSHRLNPNSGFIGRSCRLKAIRTQARRIRAVQRVVITGNRFLKRGGDLRATGEGKSRCEGKQSAAFHAATMSTAAEMVNAISIAGFELLFWPILRPVREAPPSSHALAGPGSATARVPLRCV